MKVELRDPAYTVATWRNGLLMVWTGEVTIPALDAIDKVGRRLAIRHVPYFTLSISTNGIPMPDGKTREAAAQLVKDRERDVSMTISVLEGTGFWASASRMVLATIFSLQSSRQKNKVCADLVQASIELAPFVTPKATADQVRLALRAFRDEASPA